MNKVASKTAVLITGNPKYVQGDYKDQADAFYQSIEKELDRLGVQHSRDPGLPYTEPDVADIYIGHSRGADRLKYVSPDSYRISLGTNDEYSINHSKDRSLYSGAPTPDIYHFRLTPRMRQAIRTAAEPRLEKAADNIGAGEETQLTSPAIQPGRPNFAAFSAVPAGSLHTAAGVQPGMRIPPEDLQRLATSHPDANIRARAQLVMDVAKWRANKAAAANSQTLEKAAMNKYLEKIAVYSKEYQDRIYSEARDQLSAFHRGGPASFSMSPDTMFEAVRQSKAHDTYAGRGPTAWDDIDLRGVYPKPAPKATGLKPSTKAAIAVGALGLTGAGAYAVHKHMQEKQAESDERRHYSQPERVGMLIGGIAAGALAGRAVAEGGIAWANKVKKPLGYTAAKKKYFDHMTQGRSFSIKTLEDDRRFVDSVAPESFEGMFLPGREKRIRTLKDDMKATRKEYVDHLRANAALDAADARSGLTARGAALGGVTGLVIGRKTQDDAPITKQAERDHTVTDAAVGTGLGAGAGSIYLRATRPGYSDFRKDILGEDLEKRRDRGLTRLKRNSKTEAHRAEAFIFTPRTADGGGGFSKPTWDNKLQEQSKEIRTALKSDRSAGATTIRNALKKRGRIVLGGSAVAGGVAGYGVGHAKEASFGVFAKDTAEDLVSRSPGGVMSDLGRFKDQIVRSRDSRIEANREWRDTGKDLDRLGKISTQGLQGVGANQAALMYALNKRMGLGGKTLQEYDTIRNATRNHNVKGIYDL